MRTPDTGRVLAVLTAVGEHELERRVRTSTPESQLDTPGGSQGRTAPRNEMGHDEHPPPHRPENGVSGNALPDDGR